MSFLASEGHVHADRYPLYVLWDEVLLAKKRVNSDIVTAALLTQMAVSSLFSKEAGESFSKMIKRLVDG